MLSSLNIETTQTGSNAATGFIDPLMERQAGSDGGTNSFRAKARRLINMLLLVIAGGLRGATLRMGDKHAFGTLVWSGASGTVGGIVNGVTLTAAHGASDTADATTFVAALNASTNALVQHLLKASNTLMTFTISTGVSGVTIVLGGVTLRGVPGTVIPAGTRDCFVIGDTDTNDAVSLVTVINNHPLLRDRYYATSSAGVVTVFALYGSVADAYTEVSAAGGITRSGNFAVAATALIWSIVKGTAGNTQTLAASGTGVTASGARLTGGTLHTVITL